MDIAKHWKTIVDTLQDGVLVMGPDGTIIAANPAAEQLTGYSAEELVGQSCQILNCTECNIIGQGPGEHWCSLFAEGNVKDKTCLITNKHRRSIHIIKSASVLHDENGSVIGAVETLTDISEKVRQQQEILSLKKTFHLDDGYHGILGNSPVMQKLFELIDNVSQTEAPVLIYGQSGTGKELVARAIHQASQRQPGPFVKVNCAALNENLLESELFGHVKGAYTGAERDRIGRFEAAHEGSIFLDEIGDIPLSTQVKLLRVLEEMEIERVGDHQPIPVDVRIITATNKNLEDLIAQNLFREDLLFRINVFPLHCPSLTERKEDIPIIVQNFIQRHEAKGVKKILGVTPQAMEILMNYSWPGNVRELRNIIEYALVLCPGGGIEKEHLPPKIMQDQKSIRKAHRKGPDDSTKRDVLLKVLKQTGGNQSEAARILGVSRVTIWQRMNKYGIDLETIIKT
ncbi:MAG: sigma 54-interacting transcriptional regulator [Desulfobacterales bacterium]|nr:MAG: sigma 54-interacting transcriptional regulator [Desulfobacterales bacterium]